MPNVTNFHPRRNEHAWQEEVRNYLIRGNGQFRFQKIDGSIREMICTLKETEIPKVANKMERSIDAFTVFDTEAKGWRTVKFDKIIDFKIL